MYDVAAERVIPVRHLCMTFFSKAFYLGLRSRVTKKEMLAEEAVGSKKQNRVTWRRWAHV